MKDERCVRFLQWALPQLRLRWPGFRKVRGQVCERVKKRIRELSLRDFDDYQSYLQANPSEWPRLDAMCRISISRFYRDRGEFDLIRDEILPRLARRAAARENKALRIWSAGCASGEEPFTLRIICNFVIKPDFPGLEIGITATDADQHMLDRARAGIYPESSLKDFPDEWIEPTFERHGDEFAIKVDIRNSIHWMKQDIRKEQPDGIFDLIVCRHLVFTYFDRSLQHEMLRKFVSILQPEGVLMTGKQEKLSDECLSLIDAERELHGIYRISECGR